MESMLAQFRGEGMADRDHRSEEKKREREREREREKGTFFEVMGG
jgi:hypothetical protein